MGWIKRFIHWIPGSLLVAPVLLRCSQDAAPMWIAQPAAVAYPARTLPGLSGVVRFS